MLVSLFFWIGKRVTILLPIFFYHKLAQSLLTMGFGLVVTPPGLILQPLISFSLIQQWLKVFPIPQLSTGLARLRALMNFSPNPFSYLINESEFLFSWTA
jgi:hypothetical protein